MKITKQELETIILEELTGLIKEQSSVATFEGQIQALLGLIKDNQEAIKRLTSIVESLKQSD